jgi:hypothetical protein
MRISNQNDATEAAGRLIPKFADFGIGASMVIRNAGIACPLCRLNSGGIVVPVARLATLSRL